ncbi:MAG TPA: hypothetical protein VI564_00450 [Candidatus Nanoarchaeia archaeon]|nr:hypothetical protein [Candidatus Nanoarchaeia archaeon]
MIIKIAGSPTIKPDHSGTEVTFDMTISEIVTLKNRSTKVSASINPNLLFINYMKEKLGINSTVALAAVLEKLKVSIVIE